MNHGFESGQLSPWAGYGNGPNPPGVVNVQNCCAKGGTWSSYVQPNGQYYELYQERATAPRVRYNLRSFIKTTGGLTGHLAWYSNVINDQECGSTNSAAYVKVRCELVIPPGNQDFNVHLYGTEGGGKRAISDRWKLNQLFGGNDIIWNELRIDQAAVYDSGDYVVDIKVGGIPTGGNYTLPNYFTAGWLAVNLAPCPANPALGECKFTQIGFLSTSEGVKWFVFTEHLYTCWAGSDVNGRCEGAYWDRAGVNQWQKVELVHYPSQAYWIARVYDQYGQAQDVARINTGITGTHRIYRAYVASEERYPLQDVGLLNSYYFKHPKYKPLNQPFAEWPASGGGFNNRFYYFPTGLCSAYYGFTPNLENNPRHWYSGSGGQTCAGISF